MDEQTPMFGERAVSWRTVWNGLYPDSEGYEIPHDDHAAAGMHRLRGLVMAQASETEAVLGSILKHLSQSANIGRPAGALLVGIRKLLDESAGRSWSSALAVIDQAIKRRNRVVHDTVEIGSVWRDYQTSGGEWVPVITSLGGEDCDEYDLRHDLALQQEATAMAVRLLYSVRQSGPGGANEENLAPKA